MFKGGFPGQPGNVLQALGEGYIFNKARLVGVAGSDNPSYASKSTYEGGEMTLNPSGPWCDAGTLKARGITVVDYSSQSPVLTGVLTLLPESRGGLRERAGLRLRPRSLVHGPARGQVRRESGRPIFQRGTDYEARITRSPARPRRRRRRKSKR